MSVLCRVTWHLLCHLTKYTVASTAVGPISTLGMPATGPGVPQALFPQEHQCRSTRVRSHGHICHSSGPGGSYKGSADPGPAQSPGHMPTKPLTAETTPVPALDTPSVHPDVLQALNLQSQWQRCKVVACTTTGLDFSPTSQVSWLLRLSCGFSPTSESGQPAGIYSQHPQNGDWATRAFGGGRP